MSKSCKPGTPAPKSGQNQQHGPRGGQSTTEVTAVQGKPLPPTTTPGGTATSLAVAMRSAAFRLTCGADSQIGQGRAEDADDRA